MRVGVIRKDIRRRAQMAAQTGDDSVLQPGGSETPEQRKHRLWPDDPMERWRREQRIKAGLKYRARQQLPSKEGEIDDPNDPLLFMGEPLQIAFRLLKFNPAMREVGLNLDRRAMGLEEEPQDEPLDEAPQDEPLSLEERVARLEDENANRRHKQMRQSTESALMGSGGY